MHTKHATIGVTVGSLSFQAQLEERTAPETCGVFRRLLPLRTRLLQARWSGEAAWVPLDDVEHFSCENATARPRPGQLLFYSGGTSAPEILFPYGRTRFACREGELRGNHFLTIVEGLDRLAALGEIVLRNGAQDVSFDLLAALAEEPALSFDQFKVEEQQ